MIKRNGISKDDIAARSLLKDMKFFEDMSGNDIEKFCENLSIQEYEASETVLSEGERIEGAIIVLDGEFTYELYERVSTIYKAGEIFGVQGVLSNKQVLGSVFKTMTGGKFIFIKQELFKNPDILGPILMNNLFLRLQAYYTNSYNEKTDLFNYIDVLIIQDGGCAPGKNSMIAFLTEYLERSGRRVFVAAHGYRSLVNGGDGDFRCLIDDPKIFSQLDHIPSVIHSRPLRDARGANFRSERFPEFREKKLQQQAADNAIKRHVKMLVAIGGNGTFGGLRSFTKLLPETMQVFFIPATIDSDVSGTDTIGQYTGVEVGAEKVRCYLADAYTHHRCYIVEMMGAMGGYHALHSCVGAGAHLAVLPGHQYNINAINKALTDMDNAVIVVAEGYKKEERKAQGYTGNAAEFFKDELIRAGLNTNMKLICEPFSRDIRGATPNNMDITLTQSMARKVAEMASEGKTRMMPSVKGLIVDEIPFDEIGTNNSVSADFVKLANRLY